MPLVVSVGVSSWNESHGSYSMFMACCRYEEAFHDVLIMEDVNMVAWLCSQVDPGSLLSQKPAVLSQQLLLPLMRQLGYDLLKVTCISQCNILFYWVVAIVDSSLGATFCR